MNGEVSPKTQPSFAGSSESLPKDSRSFSKEFNHRLEGLRKKLVGFAVTDEQGQFVGSVGDLIVDQDQHLNLLVIRSVDHQPQKSFLIRSKLIQQVNPRSKTLLVNLKSSEINLLPEYPMSTMSESSETRRPLNVEQNDSPREAPKEHVQPIDTRDSLPDQPVPPQVQGVVEAPQTPKAVDQDVVQEETIRLLEERLAVDYQKRKVGEVIVRKEIETQIVEVPVRREKLIVEQISPEHRQIAEIDLGQGEISGVELVDRATHAPARSQDLRRDLSGDFSSPQTAAWLMDSIARQPNHGCKRIHVAIELENDQHIEQYRQWFDRCVDR